MNFKELLRCAKENDVCSLEKLASMYKPLLIKEAMINGVFDINLYQELWIIFITCIHKVKI